MTEVPLTAGVGEAPRSLTARSTTALLQYSAAFSVCVAAALLRVALLFRYRIDSDETQHMHVAWETSRGLLQYRDFFDNHMPLFHLLSAPILWLIGERADAPLLMRLVMVPLFAAMVWLTYRIALAVVPQHAAVWATILGVCAPDFFLCSIEYRTDILWTAFWLASIAILIGGRFTPRRAAAAGLMLGLAAATSAKTILLAVCLAIAAVVVVAMSRERRIEWKAAASFAVSAIAPPALIAAYFAMRGAWKPFVYCIVTHNVGVTGKHGRLWYLPPMLFLIVTGVRRLLNDAEVSEDVRRRRVLLFVTAFGYATAMGSFWPLVETEHWLPFYPMAAVAAIPLLLSKRSEVRPWLAWALLGVQLFWIVKSSTPWRNDLTATTATIEQAMLLTKPGERVFDLKGDLVFHPRATWWVFEKLTKKKVAHGMIPDSIAKDVVRTGAMVVVPDNPGLPRAGREFLARNFIRAGCVRVPGAIVASQKSFRIEVPAEYGVVSEHGAFSGTLDGTPYTGARFLALGPHTLAGIGNNAILWSRAQALGYSPFVADARCR